MFKRSELEWVMSDPLANPDKETALAFTDVKDRLQLAKQELNRMELNWKGMQYLIRSYYSENQEPWNLNLTVVLPIITFPFH